MFRFGFATVWTAMAITFLIALNDEADALQRAVLILFAAVGPVFMWVTWRHWRRRRSLRTEQENGVTVYIWTELDGRECRSTKDPRPDWDASDGDGDGDGDGGD